MLLTTCTTDDDLNYGLSRRKKKNWRKICWNKNIFLYSPMREVKKEIFVSLSNNILFKTLSTSWMFILLSVYFSHFKHFSCTENFLIFDFSPTPPAWWFLNCIFLMMLFAYAHKLSKNIIHPSIWRWEFIIWD
jgi:hypothetical protein